MRVNEANALPRPLPIRDTGRTYLDHRHRIAEGFSGGEAVE